MLFSSPVKFCKLSILREKYVQMLFCTKTNKEGSSSPRENSPKRFFLAASAEFDPDAGALILKEKTGNFVENEVLKHVV